MSTYAVVLLYPDYSTGDYGADLYVNSAVARSGHAAALAVQEQAALANGDSIPAEDFRPILVLAGAPEVVLDASSMGGFVMDNAAPTPWKGDFARILDCHERAKQQVTDGINALVQALNSMDSWHLQKALGKISWYGDDIAPRALSELHGALERTAWEALLASSRLPTIMAAGELERLENDIAAGRAPALTPETIQATFNDLWDRRLLSFQKGVVELFRRLCRGYRSNGAFKIGSRVILHGAMTAYGWCAYSRARHEVNDLYRILVLLDGSDPGLIPRDEQMDRVMEAALRRGENYENQYFEARFFRNGNIHIYFTNAEMVERINQVIASYYGSTLAAD